MSKTIPIHAEPTAEKHIFEVYELSASQIQTIYEIVATEHASVRAVEGFEEKPEGKVPTIQLRSREKDILIMTIYNTKEALLPLLKTTLRIAHGVELDEPAKS